MAPKPKQRRQRDEGTLTRMVWLDKMKQAARLLIKGESLVNTAKKIGIHRTKFYYWMRDPAWEEIYRATAEAVNKRMDEALAQTVDSRLKVAAEDALVFQHQTLTDPDTPLPIKTRISDSLMDRDERMSKKRSLNVTHKHEILTPEVLALASKAAQAILAAQQKQLPEPAIEAEVIAEVKEEETAV